MIPTDNEFTLYQQLADGFIDAIRRGALKAGDRLPSVRKTAQSRQISINTVLTAYRSLEDCGFIEARPQSGYYVRAKLADVRKIPMPATAVSSPKTEVLDLIDLVFAAQQDAEFINVSLACPQGGEFYPEKKLARILNQLVRRQPGMIGTYSLPPGSIRLRQQIARRALLLGMSIGADDVILTHGCMDALQLSLRTVTKPGDCIGLESPTYFYMISLIASLGLKAIEIPTDPQKGVSVDAIETLLKEGKVNALLLMPSVQNPLGCSMSVDDKKRLAGLVNHYEIPLIEDGLYAELVFNGELAPTVKSFDRNGWVIFCTSFTKTLAPDFRIGWMSGGRFNQQLRRIKSLSSMCEPAVLAETLGLFLEAGGYDQHLRTLRKRYAFQVQEARALIARYFPEGTRATQPCGGFVIWVELPEGVNGVELFHTALAERISLNPGVLFSPNGRYSNAFRLSCCYPFNERYSWAIKRVGELAAVMLNNHRKSVKS
ncbi:aminotransferase-like domain-containing protein [Budvicia aquatica]|uniref:PLP-dependent aminotransferase family protein n=2 Tax=Budvicia aquatica TaxID=82979 RepID=A0A2C6DUV3_9GAMM|nr:PLP-dependent aminotransferase family protein [Budvicia aquatica]PHI32493.1 PLP-dependent aminotransferase family protein [Budvicia aquatica]